MDKISLPGAHWFPNVRLTTPRILLRHPAERACRDRLRRKWSKARILRSAIYMRKHGAHMAALQAAGVGVEIGRAILRTSTRRCRHARHDRTRAKWCSVSQTSVPQALWIASDRSRGRGCFTPCALLAQRSDYDVSERLRALSSNCERRTRCHRRIWSCALRSPQGAVTLDVFSRCSDTRRAALSATAIRSPAVFVLFTSGTTASEMHRHGGGGNVAQLSRSMP